MKIISLRFANLNSLPGPYHIRFDTAPLADTGLFAITGPTGAGKSTLLDAIAVGLYGRVPRHDRQVGEMVSRHAEEAWSEVEFEVHETDPDTGSTARVRYRSRWEMKRKTRGKDKGGLNQDTMTLALSSSGQAFLSGKSNVPDKVGELSGLDFGQFEQAVLLSQGKFARFLHAPEPERSALLEKMTNVGIYSQLSVAAFEKAKAEEQQTKLLEATLNATRLLPPDEREHLESQLAEMEEETQLVWEHQRNLSDCLAWRIQTDGLEKQLAEATREAAALATAAERLRPDLLRLAGHEQASALRPALEAEARARREVAHDADELARLCQQLPALAAAANQATTARAAAAAAQAEAEAEAERRLPVLQEAERQDIGLAATRKQLAKDQDGHATQARALAAEQAACQQLEAELADLNRQQQALDAWLLGHQHEIDLASALSLLKRDLLDLEQVNKELVGHETTQAELLKQHAAAATERQRYQQVAAEAAQRQQQLGDQRRPVQAAYDELLAGQEPAAHTQHAAHLLARRHLAERLLPLATTARQQAARAATLATEHATEATALALATTQRNNLETNTQAAHQLLDSLTETHRLQQALADLNTHRPQLQPGVPCPLCGALEHAYAADYQADAHAQQQRMSDQKTTLAALEKELRQADLALERRHSEQQQRHARRHEATQAETEARQQAAALAATHSPTLPTHPDELQATLHEATAAHEAAAATCARLAELSQQLDGFRSHHDAARDEAQQADNRTAEADFKLKALGNQLAALKVALANLREQATNYRHEAQGKLAPHQLRLPPAAPYDGLLATLAERAATHAQQQKNLDAAHQQGAAKQSAYETRVAALAQRERELAAAAQVLADETQALAARQTARYAHHPGPDPAAEAAALHHAVQQLGHALRLADDERHRQQQALGSTTERHAQRQADHARHQTDHAARLQELTEALQAANLGSAAEAQALLLPTAEADRLARLQQEQRTNEQAAARQQASLSAQLAHHYEAAPTPLATPALTAELTQLNAENERLHQRFGGVARQLDLDDQARQQQADGLHQLAARQREQRRWHDLAEQIGSAKGDKFSQFAQGLTLSHLARLANLRLRQLTGRYTILKTPNRNLELQIIDHDQAGTVRPMASLSGGESFLVSLALALGLSELAGYKARIESLFIDEGFGSLDPDALNTALDALERLQHSGKMIGVISHVADLKERIGTQIRVQPTSGGNSTVSVIDLAGNEQDCG